MALRILDAMWRTPVARRLTALGVAIAVATTAAGCATTAAPSPSSDTTPAPSPSSDVPDGWVPFDSLGGGIHGLMPADWVMERVCEQYGGSQEAVECVIFNWPLDDGTSSISYLVITKMDLDWNEEGIAGIPGGEAIILDADYSGYFYSGVTIVSGDAEGVVVGFNINVDGHITNGEGICDNRQTNPSCEDEVRQFVSLLTFTDPQSSAP